MVLYATVGSLFLLSLANPAAADPILIRAGRASLDTGDPPTFWLSGDGFSVVSFAPGFGSPIACSPVACRPDVSVNLGVLFGNASYPFSLGSGVAVVGENRYGTDIGHGSVAYEGQLFFDAATLPIANGEPSEAGWIHLVSRFVLTGSITAFQDAGVPLFHVDVTGSGFARLLLEPDTSGGYDFLAAEYIIQDPVPEPATVLLFGSGMIFLTFRACRRAATSRAVRRIAATTATTAIN